MKTEQETPDPVKTKQFVAELAMVGLTQFLNERFVRHDIQTQWDWMQRQIRLDLIGYLYGSQPKKYTVKYPVSWWEHFKERWFYKWMLKRWPVDYREHEFSIKRLYPDLHNEIPRLRDVLNDKKRHIEINVLDMDAYEPMRVETEKDEKLYWLTEREAIESLMMIRHLCDYQGMAITADIPLEKVMKEQGYEGGKE